MWFINPHGRLVEVEKPWVARMISRKKGFREATKAEINRYLRKKDKKGIELTVQCPNTRRGFDGYGGLLEPLSDALIDKGVALVEGYDGQKIGFAMGYPRVLDMLNTPIKVLLTMFESTKAPDEWKGDLQKADLILVPSRSSQSALKAIGFDSEVITLGYDNYKFGHIQRQDSEYFTFLHYNAFDLRKGWDLVLSAFKKAFPGDEKVRLILKSTKSVLASKKGSIPISTFTGDDERIIGIGEKYSRKQMVELLGKAHCFVFPSRGEGFGLPPLEALATGIPAIIPNAHGMSSYFNEKCFYRVKVKETIPAIYENFDFKDVGEMWECDVQDLTRVMRYCYEHPTEVMEKGRVGAEWARRHFTIQQTATELKNILQRFVGVRVEKEKHEPQDLGVLKVAFCNREKKWEGGDFMKMNKFAEALREIGHEVDIYSPATLDESFIKHDIIHAFNLNFKWTHDFLMRTSDKIPFVLSTINFSVDNQVSKDIQKFICEQSRALIMFTEKERKSIEEFLGIEIPDDKVHFLINGVADVFIGENPSWNEREQEVITVLNEWHPRKNMIGLALALKELKIKGRAFGEYGRYKKERDKDKYESRGYLLHRNKMLSHEKLAEEYRNSKVVCMPSFVDPFPNPVLEGLACGCNVVVSKNTFVDFDLPNVFYCDPDDPEDIAEKIKEALEAGKQEPVELPSYREQSEKLVGVYSRLL